MNPNLSSFPLIQESESYQKEQQEAVALPDSDQQPNMFNYSQQDQVGPIIANTNNNNSIQLQNFGRFYVLKTDIFLSNLGEKTFFSFLGGKKQATCYFLASSPINSKAFISLEGKLRLKRPASLEKYFIFRKITLIVEQNKKLRQFCRIIKLLYWHKDLSFLYIRQYLKLPITQKLDKYYLKTLKIDQQNQPSKVLGNDFSQAEIKSIQLDECPIQEAIIQVQPLYHEFKQINKFMIKINNQLIQFNPHHAIIVHTILYKNDSHLQIPLFIDPQLKQIITAFDLKKKVKQFIQDSFKLNEAYFQQYDLQIAEENSQKVIEDNDIIKNIIKTGTNIFKLEEKHNMKKKKIELYLQKKRFHQKIESNLLRSAMLLPYDQIIIKGRSSLQKISIHQLFQNQQILSNELEYQRDYQYSISLQRKHIHKFYGSLISITYQKNNRQFTFQIYQKNVIIFSFDNPPNQYFYCTASQFLQYVKQRKPVYIFDSINNCYKVNNTIRLQPKYHQFYSIETSHKHQHNMIVLNGIRILNTALLNRSRIVVVIDELNQNKSNYEIVYFVNKEELSIKQSYDILERQQKRHISKLPIKACQHNSIYLVHKIPHIMSKSIILLSSHNKDFYKSKFYSLVRIQDLQQIHGKLNNNQPNSYQIVFIHQSIELNQSKQVFQSQINQEDKNYYKFCIYLNNYQKRANISLSLIDTYFFIQKQQGGIFHATQLEKPSFKSNTLVIWVDDNPQNNKKIIEDIQSQLAKFNKTIQFNQFISNKMTLAWIKLFFPYFKWIKPECRIKMITDMHRHNEGHDAGAVLISEIKKLGIEIDFSFFVSDFQSTRRIVYNRKALRTIHCAIKTDTQDILRWCLDEPNQRVWFVKDSKLTQGQQFSSLH